MKTKTLLVQVALWAALAHAAPAEQNLTNSLRNGLYEEEANHNLPVAIQNYQALISRFDEERKLAATAVFRLAECYRKLGQTNEASAQYQRVTREFFDQTNLVELSRLYLGLTNAPNTGAGGAGAASLEVVADGQTYHPASEEEAKELRRVITLVKDSPDLVNGFSPGGHDTTLQTAVLGDRLAVVQYLLARGANVDAVVQNGQPATPLALAAQGGHKSMVELLLAHGANPNAHPYGSPPPLHEAARMGYNSVAEVLLTHGAEVNGKDSQGSTPLHKAVGYPKTMELLLGHGADPKLKNDAGQDPLMTAVDQNQFEAAKLLLQRHVDPNTADVTGNTALHHALTSGFTELAELLIENGAPVNAKDSKGMSELHHQVERVDLKAVEVLLSHGADATTKDANGQTPLHRLWRVALEQIINGHGAWSGSLKIAEVLIRAHLDVNATNKGGYSVLSEVIRAANNPQFGNQILEWAKLLVENHADVNARDGEGNPPLNWLVYPGNGSKKALLLLLDHGADPNVPYHYTENKQLKARGGFVVGAGATPLHMARRLEKLDFAALLAAHGAVDRAGDDERALGTNAPAAEATIPPSTDVTTAPVGNTPTTAGASLEIVADGQTYHPASEEEARELHRIIRLAKESPELLNGREGSGNNTTLQNAVFGDKLSVVQFLLAHGADVKGWVLDAPTTSASASASGGGRQQMVELLLAHGAVVRGREVQPANGTKVSAVGTTNALAGNAPTILGTSLDIVADGQTYHCASEEEVKELRQVAAVTKDSPDLLNGDLAGRHDSPLQEAGRSGHLAVAAYLLAHGAKVDGIVHEGRKGTPLALAAEGGHKAMVELLLAHGANPNAQPAGTSSALHEAARQGYNTVISVLLDHGAEVNLKNEERETALIIAVKQGQVDSVRLLLEHHADPNAMDGMDYSPLRYALLRPQMDLAELLLASGAQVNARDAGGASALDTAVAYLKPALVDFLLSHGADAGAKIRNGRTLLQSAWQNAWSLSQGNGPISARMDFSSRSLKVAELLLSHHVDVNAQDSLGRAVFDYCVLASTQPALRDWAMVWVKLLLGNHADVNVRDEHGSTPLLKLCGSTNAVEEMFRLLLDHGADPNIGNDQGWTPLRLVREVLKNKEVEALFLAHGAVDPGGDGKQGGGTNVPAAAVQTNGGGRSAKPTEQFFYVGGEVEKPNRYPYVEGLTVTKAIVIAGGSKKGNMASVRLRRAKPGPDQKSEDIIVHVARALKDPSADYPVYPGDTIWVPQLVF